MNKGWTPANRASSLLQAMTLADKVSMVHGAGAVENTPIETGTLNAGDLVSARGGRGAGWTPAIDALCIPPLYMSDGGQGFATSNAPNALGVTAFPAPIAQAAGFDPDAAHTLGRAMARQWLAKGSNVLLGPDVNAGRVPGFSRNWEGIGGEDPFLQGTMASGMISGVQSRPVIATVKHFAAYDGGSGTALVDERALHEMYEKPFQNAVDADVGAVMCAYEKVNGQWACQNKKLITDLKSQMGFSGYVVSDWGGTHSTIASAKAGLDMEMAEGSYYDAALSSAVRTGQVSQAALDGMVYRILLSMFRHGLFDVPPGPIHQSVATAEDSALARRLSQHGTVLLRNRTAAGSPQLPLSLRNGSIAVIGLPASSAGALTFMQSAASPDSKVVPSGVSAPVDAIRSSASTRGDAVVYDPGSAPAVSARIAGASDVAVVFAYTIEGELNGERTSYDLPNNQNALIEAVAAANPHTIVVINSGGPVVMPWLNRVGGVLEAWYPGEQDGNAIAGILFGDAEPGGRLPQTFPKKFSDEPPATDQYREGLYTGYRWFERQHIAPLFPFGYGLSYTSFSYSEFTAPLRTPGNVPVRVSVAVHNTGGRAGPDVPQVYVGWPSTASGQEPARQLRGYQRVELPKGASRTVTMLLDRRSFSYWDTGRNNWTVQTGCFPIWVGRDAQQMVLTRQIAVGTGAECGTAASVPRSTPRVTSAGPVKTLAGTGPSPVLAVVGLGVLLLTGLVCRHGRRHRREAHEVALSATG